MDYLQTGDPAKRNDNGQIVIVEEVRPIGLRMFYLVSHRHDGHTAIVAHEDLRPRHEHRRINRTPLIRHSADEAPSN